jgi:predicted anti-sigma-YlaC factor YlaD
MDCDRAQEAILDAPLERPRDEVQAMIDAHVAGCHACAAFLQSQREIDRRLSAHLRPPVLQPGFRAAVRRRVRHESRTFWSDLLPDALHFASWAVVTVLALIWMPLSAPVVLASATIGTLFTHAVLTALHESLDAAEDLAS